MTQSIYQRRQEGWLSENLKHSNHWRFSFDQATQNFLTDFAKKYHRPDAELFSYEFSEWDDPLISSITWVTEMLELCGGKVIFPNEEGKHLAKDRFVSHKEIIEKNPDIIFACHCGKKVKLEGIIQRAGYDQISAIKTKQVFELDPAIYLQPGPAPFLAGIDEILGIYKKWKYLDT